MSAPAGEDPRPEKGVADAGLTNVPNREALQRVASKELSRHALARPASADTIWCVCLTWSADRTGDRAQDETLYELHVSRQQALALERAWHLFGGDA